MANDQEVKYLVPGLERGLQLLLAFGEQHRDLTFAELHRLVDMPKATAYRVVQTLEYMGFLERNARTNTFSLGMNVLRLGFEYIASLDVAQVGQPVIEQLRDISQCSSHLAIRDGRDIIYIARVSAAGSRINQVSVALWQMVQQDKARGYVIGESFYRHGISSIVYPVFNRSGRVAAVVSILVPSDEIPQSDRERLQNDVSMAADKISGFLGYLSQAS